MRGVPPTLSGEIHTLATFRLCHRAAFGHRIVFGRLSYAQGPSSGEMSPEKPGSVQISPDKPIGVQMSPENERRVRISSENETARRATIAPW